MVAVAPVKVSCGVHWWPHRFPLILTIIPHACLTTAGTKKDGERVEQDRPFHYDYDQCVGGDGSCGYCSSTCDTEKGCNIVPFRMFHITSFLFFLHLTNPPLCVSVDMCAGGPCVEDDHCKEGLYCDGGKNGITANCDGVCLGEWRGALVITQTFPHFTYCCPCMFNHR